MLEINPSGTSPIYIVIYVRTGLVFAVPADAKALNCLSNSRCSADDKIRHVSVDISLALHDFV